jgi:arylsulfatase A-like enzyme
MHLYRVIVLVLLACSRVVGAADRPPNIVLIISDDQAWTDFGFMGHDAIETPHLDRLASESLVFDHGYVPSSLCCPSLASIITGTHPFGNSGHAPTDVVEWAIRREAILDTHRPGNSGHAPTDVVEWAIRRGEMVVIGLM